MDHIIPRNNDFAHIVAPNRTGMTKLLWFPRYEQQ